MKTKTHDVAQFQINSRFTLSLADFNNDGFFEAALIDEDEPKIHILEHPTVFTITGLETVIKLAREKANEILKAEALKNVEFIK